MHCDHARPHTLKLSEFEQNAGRLLTLKIDANAAPPTGEITPETAGEWLPMLARVTGYGITLSDARRRIVWANDAFCQMSGYSQEEYLGRTPGELLHFEKADPETRQLVRESFESGRGLRFECPARSKDGHDWWIDTDARPLLDANGAVKGWVCVQGQWRRLLLPVPE
jgi:PAS domain S-box-containing protein